MRKSIPIFGLLALALIMAAPAGANPISGTGCLNNSCFGNIYTLTYNTTPVSTTSTTTTWAVTLTVDTNAYSGSGVLISAAAVKISAAVTSVSLVSGPAGAGAWTAQLGGLSSSGGAGGVCDGSGAGWGCAQATTGTPAPLPNAGVYTWVFNLEIPNANALFLTPLGASIKVSFVSSKGKNAGITSEGIDLQVPPPPNNPVPEPSSLALLGTGLVSVAGMIRRRFAK